MKPRWLKNHAACPDCGLIVSEGYQVIGEKSFRVMDARSNFTCARCGAHYAAEDFWESNHDKWSRTITEETT